MESRQKTDTKEEIILETKVPKENPSQEESKEKTVQKLANRVVNKLFLKGSNLPSILSFSLVLVYYSGKIKIRKLLYSLCKGGYAFYEEKVHKGKLFEQNLIDANHIQLLEAVMGKYEHILDKNGAKNEI